jgi:hypothetical protein
MRNTWKIAILSGALLAGLGGAASAHAGARLSILIGVPGPVVYAPAPVYYPAPQVVYMPQPYYGVYYRSHPHWRHHHHQRHWR